jgi:signal transduction histidine kinase
MKLMWQQVQAWLNRNPITDPVDRRNAFFMQLLLIFEGCAIPLKKAWLYAFDPTYKLMLSGAIVLPKFALAIDMGTDLATVAAAWLGLWLIRRGKFQHAVSLFLAVLLGTALVAYSTFGYLTWRRLDLVPVEALALSSLMLGRRSLWLIYVFVMAVFAAGMTRDFFHNADVHHSYLAYHGLLTLITGYLLLVIIYDRSSSALRESLAESNEHRRQLQLEMAERERTREQLLQSQKMDAVGKLASGVAHDFNNVLGIILGFALERHRLDEPGADRGVDALALATAMHGMEMAARRGASVSRQLLNFSRQEVTHEETFDAAEALRELQPLLRQLLPAPIRLQIDAGDEPLPIRFDRSQFELALLNLASNARDAMPDGGVLNLTASATDASNLCIRVSDNGKGMSEDVRRRIFEPFYTTKPAGSGTGLGLTVIYGLVERAGGQLDVESAPGEGTTLLIRLPLATHEIMASSAPPDTQALRVLLIEDEDELRNLLGEALRHSGCEVQAVATGAEAEQLASQPAFAPHVLVCDNRLSDTDGVTLLPKLRRKLPRVPVILISAYLDTDGQPSLPVDALTERLPKPFLPTTLVARVMDAARRHR